jgi:NADH-quinone oxidoreductase subunit F
VKACPVKAITPKGKKQPVELNQELCIKCGSCYDVCKLDAVLVK